MSARTDAERFADSRPGMKLVDYAEVGLPCWRVLARCDILARKPISAFDETILGAVQLGVEDQDQLDLMLGLGEAVLEPAIASLVGRQWLRSDDGRLRVAPAGDAALMDAVQIVSRETVVPLDYDGLLRQPLTHEAVIDRPAGLARGVRTVPGYPEDPPDLAELQASRQLITRQLRARTARHRESELLAIRGIDRRDARMLLATALVFAPAGRGPCEISLVIDGVLSTDRAVALANAGHLPRLGLDRTLRATNLQPLPPYGPSALRAGLRPDVEAGLRRQLSQALRDADEARSDETTSRVAVDKARAALVAHAPRTVTPNEHAPFVDFAIGRSRSRLLIVGGRLTMSNVDDTLLRRLRATAQLGVPIRIAYDTVADGHGAALARLHTVASDHPSVIIEQRADGNDDYLLLCDDRWLIAGRFDWLGHTGDRDRPLSDRRSILTVDQTDIDAAWATADGRPRPPASPAKRSGRKSSERRSRR